MVGANIWKELGGLMICVSLRAENGREFFSQMESARKSGADLVELRADYLQDRGELDSILKSKTLPVLVTLRSVEEGGLFEGGDEELYSFLERAASGGADWIDVEWKRYRPFSSGQSKVVLSWHEPKKTPQDLSEIHEKMVDVGADLVKIAVRVEGAEDFLRLLAFQKKVQGECVVVGMGEYGEPLRILYSRLGSKMTFASLEKGGETAPGQLTISELIKEYRVRSIDSDTQLYGVIGNPVAHSRSPELFNQVFFHLHVNARYLRLPLDRPELFRKVLSALDVKGVSVTIPHKEALVSSMDEVAPEASEMGVVNTAVFQEGRLRGFNTDAPGAVEVIREAAVRRWSHGLYGMKVLVLGAGGVARAIAWGVMREGARVTISNRTLERAKALAGDLRCDFLPWDQRGDAFPQVVVNGTRLGMEGEESPFPRDRWREDMIVFDAVYTPRWTPFLQEAKAVGAETVDGVSFFLRQANLQCRHFLSRSIPMELRRRFESV